jgi:Bacterial oxidoreductases, C-terminal
MAPIGPKRIGSPMLLGGPHAQDFSAMTAGIELQDREFFAAIHEGREPNASVRQVLPCCHTLHALEEKLKRASA